MLEIINQLDGFEARGNIKVLMATNRPDVLDPALIRPGRIDRKIEYELPDLEGRVQIFKIQGRAMNIDKDVSYCEIQSPCGHDAFLLEYEVQSKIIKSFLEKGGSLKRGEMN